MDQRQEEVNILCKPCFLHPLIVFCCSVIAFRIHFTDVLFAVKAMKVVVASKMPGFGRLHITFAKDRCAGPLLGKREPQRSYPGDGKMMA